jgi:hypothetical protein
VKTIKVGEYEVKELLLKDMRAIQKEFGTDDIQYHIAGVTVYKDGSPIGADGLNELPMSVASKILMAVADINSGEEGNG